MLQDKDLLSVQHVRNLVASATKAQEDFCLLSQDQIDEVLKHISESLTLHAEELARMAVEETGFGVKEDKVTKNLLASEGVYNYIKDQKIVGILDNDIKSKVMSVGVPVGVVAGLVPSTNPTSTTIYKSLISLKAGNAVIFSPHPSAIKCVTRTTELIRKAIAEKGVSPDLVSVLPLATIEATAELMRLSNLILATGGPAMVKAAYSSGTPALGVGPGNVPAFIERSADIKHAVACILKSKTFDNGTICASEQMVITEECIEREVEEEFKRQGAYFLNDEEQKKVEKIILNANKNLNAKIVGKSVDTLAAMAGISVPSGSRILIGRCKGVGKDHPFSVEKLSPLLGYYVERDWESACQRSIEILKFEGIGHSLAIHTKNEVIVKEFALRKPVSRLLVNTPAALGGVGATTGLAPAFTLGCGSVGGSSISDNVEPRHLANIRRVAYDLSSDTAYYNNDSSINQNNTNQVDIRQDSLSDNLDIKKITQMVIEVLNNR